MLMRLKSWLSTVILTSNFCSVTMHTCSEVMRLRLHRLRDNLWGWKVCLRPSEKQVGDSLRPGSNQVGGRGRRRSNLRYMRYSKICATTHGTYAFYCVFQLIPQLSIQEL